MGIYQDKKSGKWYFEAMIRGKRYHRAISEAVTKKDAEIYFNAFKTDLLRGRLDLVDNIGCKPFKELVKVYVEYSKTNHRSYKTNVAKAYKFEKIWGNKQLKDISPIDIEKYKINRKKEVVAKEKIVNGEKIPAKTVSNTTINRDIEVLRKMFNIAIENGWLVKNPCANIKKLRQTNKIERFLSSDEEIALLEVCKGRFEYIKPIIQFALNTGMRKEEILSLKWRCVDFEENKITLLDTKNGEKRFVPMNSDTRTILIEARKKRVCDYVFANPITQNRYADLKGSFKAVCKLAGIENLRFHDLRHTAATRMANDKANILVVQNILGHKDIKTTMRYAHPIPEEAIKAVELLSNYAERNKKIVKLQNKQN